MTAPRTSRPDRRRPAALVILAALTACADGSFQASEANDVPGVAFALTPGDPLEAQRVLGQRLFFDEHLSIPQGVSCGMCHNPSRGWGDGRPQGKGVQDHTLAGDVTGDGVEDHESTLAVEGNFFKTILTPRNTPTIYNSSLFPNTFWDGRAGELIHQARFPLEEAFEMNSSWAEHALPTISEDPISMELWRTAYGDDLLTVDRAAEAIGVYEASISAFDTPYDAFLAGDANAFTAEEQAGHDLFFGKAGCAACHPGPLLTDFAFHNTGMPTAGENLLAGQVDLGRGKFTDLTQDPPVVVEDPTQYAAFRTPQLRMLAVTAPYMHNGVLASLEEVVEFYDQGGGPDQSGTGTKSPLIQPLGLTESERAALVAFLETGLMGTEIR